MKDGILAKPWLSIKQQVNLDEVFLYKILVYKIYEFKTFYPHAF